MGGITSYDFGESDDNLNQQKQEETINNDLMSTNGTTLRMINIHLSALTTLVSQLETDNESHINIIPEGLITPPPPPPLPDTLPSLAETPIQIPEVKPLPNCILKKRVSIINNDTKEEETIEVSKGDIKTAKSVLSKNNNTNEPWFTDEYRYQILKKNTDVNRKADEKKNLDNKNKTDDRRWRRSPSKYSSNYYTNNNNQTKGEKKKGENYSYYPNNNYPNSYAKPQRDYGKKDDGSFIKPQREYERKSDGWKLKNNNDELILSEAKKMARKMVDESRKRSKNIKKNKKKKRRYSTTSSSEISISSDTKKQKSRRSSSDSNTKKLKIQDIEDISLNDNQNYDNLLVIPNINSLNKKEITDVINQQLLYLAKNTTYLLRSWKVCGLKTAYLDKNTPDQYRISIKNKTFGFHISSSPIFCAICSKDNIFSLSEWIYHNYSKNHIKKLASMDINIREDKLIISGEEDFKNLYNQSISHYAPIVYPKEDYQ